MRLKPFPKRPVSLVASFFSRSSAVRRALGALLRDLDDLAPDEPVRVDHRRVDRSRDARARLVEDRGDALVEMIFRGVAELVHGG